MRSYSPYEISWIGTLLASLSTLTGVVAGPIYDRGYHNVLLFVGSFFYLFGIMLYISAPSAGGISVV